MAKPKISAPQKEMRAVRVFSYSAAGVLAILMMSSIMPPIFGNFSERALINAPVRLMTAPIDGKLDKLRFEVGDSFASREVIATIVNREVSQDKLIELELTLSDLSTTITNRQRTLVELDALRFELQQELDSHKEAIVGRAEARVKSAAAEVKLATAKAKVAAHALKQREDLVTKKVYSKGGTERFEEELSAANAERVIAESAYDAAVNELSEVNRGVFANATTGQANAIATELRAQRREVFALRSELRKLSERRDEVERTLSKERRRIRQLSQRSVQANAAGSILDLTMKRGMAIHAGEPIARAINCRESFVLAIFSERKAQDLQAGREVTITGDHIETAVKGVVRSLEPRATNASEIQYAVPFPPAERRELYAIIDFLEHDAAFGEGTCNVGGWVSVSIEGNSVPSPDELVSKLGRYGSRVYASWTGGEEVEQIAPTTRMASRPVVPDPSDEGPAEQYGPELALMPMENVSESPMIVSSDSGSDDGLPSRSFDVIAQIIRSASDVEDLLDPIAVGSTEKAKLVQDALGDVPRKSEGLGKEDSTSDHGPDPKKPKADGPRSAAKSDDDEASAGSGN